MANNAIQTAYVNSVKARLAGNGNSSWGGADSVATIEAIADEAYGSNEGFDVIRNLVAALVNPSAFAQQLEKLPEGNPMKLKRTEGKKRGGGNAAMALLSA